MKAKKVLSVQSHVVHGYVGNKAATFPLQYRGWDVDALNTVQFSNHPGYGCFTGSSYEAKHLQQIILHGVSGALHINYSAVLLGYLPDSTGLLYVTDAIKKIQGSNPELMWLIDPVLGDNGRLYVPESMVSAYKSILKDNIVTIVTPNQFEMATLTDIEIVDFTSLKSAIDKFHSLYPQVLSLVVTSVQLAEMPDYFIVACSDIQGMHYFKIPHINAVFSGSGDLFSALLVDSFFNKPDSLPAAVSKALSFVDKVLKITYSLECADRVPNREACITIRELRLVEARHMLRDPVELSIPPLPLR